jgi:hypothetical protein
MTDTVEYPKAYSCCMRQNPDAGDILEDGININFVLTLVYIGSYALGLNITCLGSFLAILLNSMYMISLVYPGVDGPDNGNTGNEDDEDNAEDEQDEQDENDENDEQDENDLDKELSLKQREHGAAKSKCLSEEDDAVLYKKLYEIVRETQRRNDERSRALLRTPTSSSLAEPVDSEDEYADMPPLVHANSVLRYRNKESKSSTAIPDNHQRTCIKDFLDGYNTMDDVD